MSSFTPHLTLRVATLNVRGLADRKRQSQLYRIINEQDLDIVALQETKVESEENTERMVRSFCSRYQVCVSHAVGYSAGCLLLIRQSIGAVVQAVTSDTRGRMVVCDLVFASKEWRVICVYAPIRVDERKGFFEECRAWLGTERALIVLGDFNCVCGARDKSSTTPFRDGSTVVLDEIVADFGLEDVGNVISGAHQVQFTHFQGASHARLDRAYVSLELVPECCQYAVHPISFSDHCLVSFSLGRPEKKASKFNWDLWKMNSKLVQDEQFVADVKGMMEKIDGRETNLTFQWEMFKQNVKIKALERSSVLRNNKMKNEKVIRENLKKLTEWECESPGLFKEDIKSLKAQLEAMEEERYHGALVRARAEKLLLGEAPTKRAISSEKRYANRNMITDIEYKGAVSKDQQVIKRAFCEHYNNLFARHPIDPQVFKEDFMTLLPAVEDERRTYLETSITIDEVKQAISELSPGKTPGPDGLCGAFYKAFVDELSPILCALYAEAYELKTLPPSFSKSHTVLIPKTEDAKELMSVNAYRPITLTNVDYKILMKVLAKRLQTVMKDLVGQHQTCGIKGRSITTNIHVTRSILECCDCMQSAVALLQIDLEKAFDQVSHELLLAILEHVNVGKVITDGVRMSYKECATSLVINKALSTPVKVSRSVRQGCPLSPLLFCLFIESFCLSIKNSASIRGFRLQSCEVRVLAYADDIALFFEDRSSIGEAVKILKRFCYCSGSSVNWKKCLGLWHGNWDATPSTYEGISWEQTPPKYLGVPLENYRDSDPYWRRQVTELRDRTERWEGKGKMLSMFARATACNLFFAAKVWYVMQVLHCARANVQRLHRVFAVFIWGSTWERTSRTNLFRRVRSGGLSLAHLFLRQVVNRFFFLREGQDPFLRTVVQVRLGRVLPQYVVSSTQPLAGGIHGYLREVVQAAQFLCARFSMEYLCNVPRKKLYRDLLDVCLPVPLYRTLYGTGTGQDVLKRVKVMAVPPGVKSFFFKLHAGVLPVKTWMQEKGLFVPWGVDCTLCKKPETIEHVFLDCWDAVFLWDVLQRTLKKELPLDCHGIRFLCVEDCNGVPYDLLMLLVLHGIWRSRMAFRNSDIDARPARQYFCENVRRIIEVWKVQPCVPDWLSEVEKVLNMPRF